MASMEWVTLVLSIYGSILATIVAVSQLLQKRRRVKVSGHFSTPLGPTPMPNLLTVRATNIGHRPVTISSAGILRPGGETFQGFMDALTGGAVFPADLSDGHSVEMRFFYDELVQKIRAMNLRPEELKVYARDSTGRVWSAPIPTLLAADLRGDSRNG